MSEFLHLDSVKLFMGDETGRPGRLGNILSRHQRGVLLFDEIGKSHRLLWDLLLQMLDAARITLADHRAYDLSGFYIVCTSNIGARQLLRPTRLPFTTLERAVISELHGFFRPELIGRFDEKIVFRPLCPDTQREIAWLTITEERTRLRERGFDFTISDEAFEFLVRRGIHRALGARPMKKAVQKFIGDAVRDALKAGAQSSGVVTVSPLNDRLMIMESKGDSQLAVVSYYATVIPVNWPSIWDYLPQPEKDFIPQDREDRQVYTGYWIYYNRDGSILFGTETREYFGILPAEIARAVPESVINCIAA